MKQIAFSPPWQVNEPLPSRPEAPPTPTAGIPIVIAEDDPVSRELITSLVAKWGFQSIVTRDGQEAMAALRATEGTAIALLDWMMPGMDGLQICRRVRESEKTVYIILLTARGARENIVEGLQAGADDYLVKPYDKSELFARIQVGLRILDLHNSLAKRVAELEDALLENKRLRHDIPL